jgi:hypothetical protein
MRIQPPVKNARGVDKAFAFGVKGRNAHAVKIVLVDNSVDITPGHQRGGWFECYGCGE